jgi:hypothetical protein
MSVMSDSVSETGSIDAPPEAAGEHPGDHPEASGYPDVDPAIAEAVDGVANRFGVQGLEHMQAYAEHALAEARAALAKLAEDAD